MGDDPCPFALLILPFTRGAIQLADARGFIGIAFEARGTGNYVVLFDRYGVDGGAPLDLTRLRALIVQLHGDPGGKVWLQLKLRFY